MTTHEFDVLISGILLPVLINLFVEGYKKAFYMMAHKDSGGRLFEIKDHVIPCLHLREDIVRTSLDDGADWMMSVRQYTPLDNLKPSEGDVTILGAPCLGFPKVCMTCSKGT